MKRIFSLLLCFVMLLSVALLASCGAQSDDEAQEQLAEDASKSAITLTMYVVTEEETTEEAQQLVSEALNKLTKSEFKTQLKMIFLTEDEYYSTMDALLADNEEQARLAAEAKKNKGKNTDTSTESATESETLATETNEYGVTVTRYPNVPDNQVDILYIGSLGSDKGYDKYQEYIENNFDIKCDEEKCIQCMDCFYTCPEDAIAEETPMKTNLEDCTSCSTCINVCSEGARSFSGPKYYTDYQNAIEDSFLRKEAEFYL